MDLESLYLEIILDHYKHPRGRAELPVVAGESYQVNPTCGDEVTVQVALDESGGLQVAHHGQGCSISQASASVMTELVVGMTPAQAAAIRLGFLELMRSKGEAEPDEELLGDGIAFAGVSKYPARVKCALLPWMALQAAEAKAGIAGEEPAS